MAPTLAYQTSQVSTSSQGELLVLLYRAGVRFGTKARLHLQDGDLESAHNCLMKAQSVVVELVAGLPPVDQTTRELQTLHDYIYRTLVRANLEKSTELLDEALGHLRNLLHTWEHVALAANAPAPRVMAFDQRC